MQDINVLLANLLPFIVLIAVAYFLMIRPAQKRNKEQKELLSSLKVGDKVTSIGGIHGTIRAVDTTTVVVAVNGKGTELTFDKQAIRAKNA